MKRSVKLNSIPIALIITVLSSCKSPVSDSTSDLEAAQVAGNQIGQFKGLRSISDVLSSRLMEGSNFNLITSIKNNDGYRDLEPILGAFNGVGIKNKFSNGIPNPLNSLLWSTLLKNFAAEITSRSCDFFRINDEAVNIIGKCFTSKTQASDEDQPVWEENPKALWTLLMQQDAPPTEYQAWIEWLKSKEFNAAYQTKYERLQAAISAITLNPYFLLEN